jgi:xylan 1,4-beta-xylosidase
LPEKLPTESRHEAVKATSVVCNPLDIAYQFQDFSHLTGDARRAVFREGADPSVVRFKGHFYMFVSMTRGFWHSVDLAKWKFQPSDKLQALDYAPDVREIDGALYISASRRNRVCPFFRSENPLEDDFTEIAPGTFSFWDPNLFQDDDGKVYFYWGCSSETPLYGTEMDSSTFTPLGERQELFFSDTQHRGWEQTGENNAATVRREDDERPLYPANGNPYIEGAWMTKRGGTYYLQYAAPGTEFNTYADGYFTSASPLGPFDYSSQSPFSSKPGGFIAGAGHGSTFEDEYGNWWHAATMRVSINHPFERRVGIFPAGFDEDGVLFCNQNFADYPMRIPAGKFDPWLDVSAGWMLLSLNSTTHSSSALPEHGPELAVNEDIRSWWVAGSADPGEWLETDLGRAKTIHAIQVNLADHDLAGYAPVTNDGTVQGPHSRSIDATKHPTELLIETSLDRETWQVVVDSRGTAAEHPHGFVVLDNPHQAQYVRVIAGVMPYGAPFSVSGLRVFGLADGPAPDVPRVSAERLDTLTARIEWPPVNGAQGYNVRWGNHPGKLYHSWLTYGETRLDLRSLNADQPYWISVDSFNESGITMGAQSVKI